jgi:predicted nuclease of restriction endonuclease-like (RecB) superfamily
MLAQVKADIAQARTTAVRHVNRALIELYWSIGGTILEQQKLHGWGKSVIQRLASDLREPEVGPTGFSPQNLWYMRQFHDEYEKEPILQQLVGELPWGHNILIMTKVKQSQAREFYLRASALQGWSRSALLQQIKADAWNRQGLSANNFATTLSMEQAGKATSALKESYLLEFLKLEAPVLEREIEQAMVANLRQLLLEFGNEFAFMGNQFRVAVGKKEVFIDMLFYHRTLRCLVAIELKAGAFTPEHAGKMNYYLNILDDHVRVAGEGPSIGIILCADRDAFDVEYALRGLERPVGVSEYMLTKKLPSKWKKLLPSPTDLVAAMRTQENGK